jgi:hypothetical protein
MRFAQCSVLGPRDMSLQSSMALSGQNIASEPSIFESGCRRTEIRTDSRKQYLPSNPGRCNVGYNVGGLYAPWDSLAADSCSCSVLRKL